MIFFRKLHKWLGLVIGAQLIIWLLSGSLISLLLGVQGGALIWLSYERKESVRKIIQYCLLPGLASLIGLVALTRPWAQSELAQYYEYSLKRSFLLIYHR